MDIQLGVEAAPVAEGVYEVCVTATVHTKIEDKTVFLVEAKQAGIFEIRNLADDQMGQIMGIACPQIVYPYLRGNVADLIQRGGFPPVHLSEINFQAMYEQQQAGRGWRTCGYLAPVSEFRGSFWPLARMDIAQAAMKIIVLGAGAWGTALAISAARAP